MLPEPYRLHHRADFSRTVRRGRRIGRRDLVVHVFIHGYDGPVDSARRSERSSLDALIRIGGPRFGLIVSKAVGDAVTRHRVARRLRHLCARVIADVPPQTDVVIRALPGSALASADDLSGQLRGALRKVGAAVAVRTDGHA